MSRTSEPQIEGRAGDGGDARVPRTQASGPLAVLLALALPGAGHFYLRRRSRALFFFCLVTLCIGLGIYLQGKLQTAFDSPLSLMGTVASMGAGLPYAILRWIVEYQGNVRSVSYEYGTTFLMTGGLLNLLLVLDTWDIAAGRKP